MPSPRTLSLWNCEEMNFYCLSTHTLHCPVYGILTMTVRRLTRLLLEFSVAKEGVRENQAHALVTDKKAIPLKDGVMVGCLGDSVV